MLKRITTGAGLVAVTLGFFALRTLDIKWFFIYLALISIFSTFLRETSLLYAAEACFSGLTGHSQYSLS